MKCPETMEELQELEKALPLCRKAIYEACQAKLESGAAYSKREAERQISEETGRPLETIRTAIKREQSHDVGSLNPLIESSHNLCPLPATTPPRPHVAQNTGDNEWYTPPELIGAACRVMGKIDLDPASSGIANKTVGAIDYYDADTNGLSKDWFGKVWLNPPYASNLISQFCEKLCYHLQAGDISEAIVLVNNATETAWFGLLASHARAIVFPKSRIRFLDPEGNPGAPLQGQAVLYFGDNHELFFEEFLKFGWGVTIWD